MEKLEIKIENKCILYAKLSLVLAFIAMTFCVSKATKERELKNIAKVISRWYDVEIVFENKQLESVKFVGALNKHQSIEEILSIMKSTSINNHGIRGKTIILK